jgi:Transcriptional regulatory protein, C terminal
MIAQRYRFTVAPVPPDEFVGRRDAVRDILRRAGAATPSLLSVEGPSKIGRTSLLHYVAAISRQQVRNDLLPFEGKLNAPYIDLAFSPYHARSVRSLILNAIGEEMALHGHRQAALPDDFSAVSLVAGAMERGHARGERFLLLFDHVEHLLKVRGARDERQRAEWSEAALDTIGELNERLRIEVLLAFGATGPARDLSAAARRLQMLETLDAMSQIMHRPAWRIELGLLRADDVRTFASHAAVHAANGTMRGLSDSEVEWIVEISGGHPFVMQEAGVRLFELKDKGARQSEWKELERQLADPGLQKYILDAMRRMAPADEVATSCLGELANGSRLRLPRGLRSSLLEEGLVQCDDDEECWMPSRGLRFALRRYLEAVGSDTPRTGPTTGRPLPSVSIRGGTNGNALSLTPSEYGLLRVLLQAPPGEVVARRSLAAALGTNTKPHQLTQRLSVLRQKMAETLAAPDAIENVYRQGYRLVDADRFTLHGPQ